MTKISDVQDGTLYFVPKVDMPVQTFATLEPLSLYRLVPGHGRPEYYHEDEWETSSIFRDRPDLELAYFTVYDDWTAALAAVASLVVDTSNVPHMWRRKGSA